jgi:hypothetical protein
MNGRPHASTNSPQSRETQTRRPLLEDRYVECIALVLSLIVITDVFRSRPLLCTIHHLINFTLASVENVPVVPAVLDKGHQ